MEPAQTLLTIVLFFGAALLSAFLTSSCADEHDAYLRHATLLLAISLLFSTHYLLKGFAPLWLRAAITIALALLMTRVSLLALTVILTPLHILLVQDLFGAGLLLLTLIVASQLIVMRTHSSRSRDALRKVLATWWAPFTIAALATLFL